MSKDGPPSFQFYPRDFMSDPAVLRMGIAARGAFLNLLCASWLSEDPGRLPSDDQSLAELSLAGGLWPEVREAVLRAFKLQDGFLVQKRMVMEREAQRRRHERASAGGKLTAEKRWKYVAPLQSSDSLAPTLASASAVESKEDSKKAQFMQDKDGASPASLVSLKEDPFVHEHQTPEREPGVVAGPDSGLPGLADPRTPEPLPTPAENRAKIRAILGGLATGMSPPSKVVRLVSRQDVQDRLGSLNGVEARVAYRIVAIVERGASWVRPSVLLGIVDHWLTHRESVKNPYAYYRPGSPGFVMVEQSARLREDEVEHEKVKHQSLFAEG